MKSQVVDLMIIGGGIVGCATAEAISARRPELRMLLCEKEDRLAAHQTGHNSGVIHSGLYYKPGSLKAEMCAQGRESLYRFCQEHLLPHERCGKIVVATDENELPALDELARRGAANGLDGLQSLGPQELRDYEPHVRGIAGLFVPQTGIVDFSEVTQKLAELFSRRGGEVRLQAEITRVCKVDDLFSVRIGRDLVRTRAIVNCAGLQSDLVAKAAGVSPGLRIVPFRGEYYQIKPEKKSLVKNLIYPVPDPQMPFLGVHFTRMIDGSVEAGPNAVLAWSREGYRRFDISIPEMFNVLSYRGFWKLSTRFWKQGIEEHGRSFFKGLFVNNLQRLIPELRGEDLVPGHSGVRAQAVDADGRLVDDFRILTRGRMVHVLNAPSPAATASLSIAAHIADRVEDVLEKDQRMQ